jgi:hypothetical protein
MFAATVVLVGIGFAMSDEFQATIKKVDGDKVTFAKKVKKGETAKDETMSAAGVKVFKGKFNKETKMVEKGDAIEGALSADVFKNIPENGVGAFIITSGDKITEIRVTGKKKKAAGG